MFLLFLTSCSVLKFYVFPILGIDCDILDPIPSYSKLRAFSNRFTLNQMAFPCNPELIHLMCLADDHLCLAGFKVEMPEIILGARNNVLVSEAWL